MDYVTNSSSSSFVIARNEISYDMLLQLLLEIANEEEEEYMDDPQEFTVDDIRREKVRGREVDCVAYRYNVIVGTKEQPYTDINGKTYDDHYYVTNESNGRYDWDVIEDILSEHNVHFNYGYCD